MDLLSKKFLEENYPTIKESKLFGRWIRISDIEPLYKTISKNIKASLLGFSEGNLPIYRLKFGDGKKKILIWSQMHGNESTGTKSVFDLLNFVKLYPSNPVTQFILKECTVQIIPMLNPDGAEVYTRENANAVDLNRDAVDRIAQESKLLFSVLKEFNPDFCFNLHDQRTIFGLEGIQNPATISFLAPSEEITRKITDGRKKTMDVIVAMNNLLQQIIPNYVGRYTDEFYPTATGDNFQKMGHNTILIEAGHYPNDYNREKVREFNFYALLKGILHISKTEEITNYKEYFNIPNNVKKYFDVIHRKGNNKDVAYQYKEQIINSQFVRKLQKEIEGNLSDYLAHTEINV